MVRGGVLSIQYTFLSVCMWRVYVCMLPVCSATTGPNELKFDTLTAVSSVGLLQPLEALAAMRIVGVASENVRVVTRIRLNLPSK